MEAYDNSIFPYVFFDLFSFQILLNLFCGIYRFFLSYWFLLRCQFLISSYPEENFKQTSGKLYESRKGEINRNSNEEANEDDCWLLGQEIKMVAERLGIECCLEGEELQKRWSLDEVCGDFEEEPSLQEVKEAFDVFDENKDGFIDAEELQSVLCKLGFMQGTELHACSQMIAVFDVNGDGKIDFNEFVKFILNRF